METTSDRTLNCLFLFSATEPEWTVELAAERLGVSVSTAYRYFRSLAACGLISAFAPGRYVLGPAILELDRQMRMLDPLVHSASPVMHSLIEQIGHPGVTLLCRPYHDRVMCVHQETSRDITLHSSYERGRPMSLFQGSMSKIILAYMPPRSVKSLYSSNKEMVARGGLGRSWAEMRTLLRQLRNQGYSVSHAELDPGVAGISVPIFDIDRQVAGSLGFVCLERDFETVFADGAVSRLQASAKEIETALSNRIAAGSNETQS